MQISIVSVTLLLSTLAQAAEVTGRWQARFSSPRGERQIQLDLQLVGQELSGTVRDNFMGESKILNGRIRGDEISFQQVWEWTSRKITFFYTGRVKGDEIMFTRKVEGRSGEGWSGLIGEVKFTARRASGEVKLEVGQGRERHFVKLPEPVADDFRPMGAIRLRKPITNVSVLRASELTDQVSGTELVLGVVIDGEARAYPINMLTGPQREIINDTLRGRHIAATW